MLDEQGIVNKIVTFVMIAILGWLAFTVQEMSVEQAVQGAQMAAIRETIALSQTNTYTVNDANAAHTLIETKIKRLEEWNQNLSERVREVERLLRDNAVNQQQ